jgi:replication-associated recombination protein RarA
VVEQEYLPEELAGTRYYQPSEHGAGAEVAERMRSRTT